MRIGAGTRIGGVSVFASKTVHPGKSAGGCLVWLFRLAFLPFLVIYLYVRWCIENNGKHKDSPIYARPWVVTTSALVVLFIVAGTWTVLNQEKAALSTEDSATSAQNITPAFTQADGYDMVQSLFLSLEGTGSTYDGFIQNVKGSGMEYLDRFVAGGRCVEVWMDRDSEEHTNKLEVTFFNAGENSEYIRTAEYWHDDSAVRVSLHNNFESYEDGSSVLCIIDATEKSGATFAVTDYSTIAEAMQAITEK